MADIQPSLGINYGAIIPGAAPNLDNTPVVSQGGLCDTQSTPWKEPLENPPTDLASEDCMIPEDKE